MIKKLFILLVTLMMCSGLIACANSAYRQGDFGGTFVYASASIEPVLITKQNELIYIFSEYDIVWDNGLAIWQRYDNKFFEKNALILYFFGVSGDEEPDITIDKIEIDDDLIQVSLIQHGLTEGLMYFQKNMVIEINKNIIGQSTNVKVDLKIK